MPEAVTQQGLPQDFRLIWVSSRKAGPVADGLAANIVSCYLLHELMASVKLPLDELSSAHLVAIEIPPVALRGFEHSLLHLIAKIRAIGPHVAIIVQPSLRRRTQQALWVHRWNKIDQRPFQLIQTCSCKLGNKCQGCHFPLLVGVTFDAVLEPCSRVPTPGAQSLTLQRSLCGALSALSALLPFDGHSSPPPEVFMPETAQEFRRPGTTVVGTDNYVAPRPQRTPDSKMHCSPQCVTTISKTPPTDSVAVAYPTDAKEKERIRRNERKARGEVIVVKKKKFAVEDHHDDCGDDLSSLEISCYAQPCDYGTDSDLSDQDHNQCLLAECSQAYFPIDIGKVARAQEGSTPHPGRDPRAKAPKESSCLACKHYRARDDWEHNRIIGECSYPYDEPTVPLCGGCQKRKPRFHHDHSYVDKECRWAVAQMRTTSKRTNPHQPAGKSRERTHRSCTSYP